MRERKIEMIEFELDLDQEIYDFLVSYGLEKIKDDKEALISYAIKLIIADKIKQ